MASIAWKVVTTVTGIAAGKVATKVTTATWKAATGGKPPASKLDPAYSAAQITVFTIVSAAVTSGIKAFSERKAADFYTRSTGTLPPPVAKQRKKAEALAAKADEKAKLKAK